MLKTAQNLRNVITIFHNPQLKSSRDLVATVTDKFKGTRLHRFDLQIEEGNPTTSQLNTLKSFTPMLSNVASPADLPRPTLVSWFNGKVAVANDERAIAILNSADSK